MEETGISSTGDGENGRPHPGSAQHPGCRAGRAGDGIQPVIGISHPMPKDPVKERFDPRKHWYVGCQVFGHKVIGSDAFYTQLLGCDGGIAAQKVMILDMENIRLESLENLPYGPGGE